MRSLLTFLLLAATTSGAGCGPAPSTSSPDDAGPSDAGALDAGTLDGGAADAALDAAGPTDAGPCDGIPGCVPCSTPSVCPGEDSECSMRTCEAGVCGVDLAPVGTPLAAQTPDDCKRIVCAGTSGTIEIVDDNDLVEDGNECTTDACSNGTRTSTPEPGRSCAAGLGGCSAAGLCVEFCAMVDPPDASAIDENGDGIDGLAGCSVFVSRSTGSDDASGLAATAPVASLARAIAIASSFSPPRSVLVAEGEYPEDLSLVSGVSLFGGYDPTTWARDPEGGGSVVAGIGARAVTASSLVSPVQLQGLTIRGASFATDGQSTVALWVSDTATGMLAIDHCRVEAGNAGRGADGASGAAGANGGNGMNGSSSGDPGPGGTSSCGSTGGEGGRGTTCPSTAGAGGTSADAPISVGAGGAPGASRCGSDCDDYGNDGLRGSAGGAGTGGTGGTAPADGTGTLSESGWTAPGGPGATRGLAGGGGGGGGAGGFDIDSPVFCVFDSGNGIGGGGGGGGGGGCGGGPGSDGAAGGGSFAVVLVRSSIALSDTAVVLGTGGAGGAGGTGGAGGAGSWPGGGAQGTDSGGEPGNGAEGGLGGPGGGGGGGAGGCGGPAVGIARVFGATTVLTGVSFSGGTAGAPGSGSAGGQGGDGVFAPDGAVGCPGVRAETIDQPAP